MSMSDGCIKCKEMLDNYKYSFLCEYCMDDDKEQEETNEIIIQTFKLDPIKEAVLKGIIRTLWNNENFSEQLCEYDYETAICMIIQYKNLLDPVTMIPANNKITEIDTATKINNVNNTTY
jgi:hypothetical protein